MDRIIKDGTDVNEIENRRTIERINKTTGWFFAKINKVNKPLAKPAKRKRRFKLLKSG